MRIIKFTKSRVVVGYGSFDTGDQHEFDDRLAKQLVETMKCAEYVGKPKSEAPTTASPTPAANG